MTQKSYKTVGDYMNKRITFLQCYTAFFKISLFTFGGGYAMLPMVEKELVEGKACISEKDMLDSYALAQTIPGIIGANMAALVGKKVHGIKGAIASIMGFISPSIIIIMLISDLLIQYQEHSLVNNALKGIKAAVLALLIHTFIKLVMKSKESIRNIFSWLLILAAFISVLFFGISPIYVIVCAAFAGILYYKRKGK